MSEDTQTDAVGERPFHARLLQIDSDLHQHDIDSLKYLLKDVIKGKATKITYGRELFSNLESSRAIRPDNVWLLVECFKEIGRDDLVDILDLDEDEVQTSLHQHIPTGKISDYRLTLFDIAQDLTKDETNRLCYLADKISKSQREKLATPLGVFTLLEQSRVIDQNNVSKLRSYMVSLGRQDIVEKLDAYDEKRRTKDKLPSGVLGRIEPQAQPGNRGDAGSADLPSIDLRSNRKRSFETQPAPASAAEPMDTREQPPSSQQGEQSPSRGLPVGITLGLSHELSSQDLSLDEFWSNIGYTDDNLTTLKETLPSGQESKQATVLSMLKAAPALHGVTVDQALVKVTNALRFSNMVPIAEQLVEKYKDQLPKDFLSQLQKTVVSPEEENLTIISGEARAFAETPGAENSYVSTGGSSQSGVQKDTTQSSLPAYKMNANPRGICVIINNMNFQPRLGERQLPPRQGSEIDARKLEATFKKLHFTIHVYKDIVIQEIKDILTILSQQSVLAEHDCFVCCVLTHGKMEGIYGSDSCLMNVSELQAPFKSKECPNLAGKPKLFFLQACQGQDKQEGIEIVQGDIFKEESSSMEADGPEMEIIPNEADFLLGYATAPGFVSYRSKSQGSWYISKLTELLDKYAGSEDLLSILTKVNQEVGKLPARIEGGLYKQAPAPQYTLRKKVIFREVLESHV